MTQQQLDADQLLGALGELHRTQRTELAHLDEPARELAEREPERAVALEARLLHELCGAAGARPARARRIGRGASLAAASCAMAAAALLWVHSPAQTFDVSYTLVAPAPDAVLRSAAASPVPGSTYTLGRTLAFTLRPDVRYSGELRFVAYAAKGGELIQLDPEVQRDPAGGAKLLIRTGPGSALSSEGSWELRFYVSPTAADALTDADLQQRRCPETTRCLTVSAQLVQPKGL